MDDGYSIIVIDKTAKTLFLVQNGETMATYPVLVGQNPGHKRREGDGRTPEGLTFVLRLLPDEAAVGKGFHKGLHLAYPLVADAFQGLSEKAINPQTAEAILHAYRTGGIPPQETALGGYVAIHGGLAPDEPFLRGTKGCVVLRNTDMDEVYAFAQPGMLVLIFS